MPVYEYECGTCHFRFERKQGFSEEPVALCPQCRGRAHRVLHSVPIFFKGSGFYSTDYRRGWQGSSEKEKKEPTESKGGEEAGAKE